MDSGFAQMPSHGGSSLPAVDPSNPMNLYYLQHIEQHARRNPHDMNAQRLYAHWLQSMQQIDAARLAAAGSATSMPQPMPQPGPLTPGQMPQPVPSHLLWAEAPTPPTTSPCLSPAFGRASTGPLFSDPVLHGVPTYACSAASTTSAACLHSRVCPTDLAAGASATSTMATSTRARE